MEDFLLSESELEIKLKARKVAKSPVINHLSLSNDSAVFSSSPT